MSIKRIAYLTRANYSYHLQVGWRFFSHIQNSGFDWLPIVFHCREASVESMEAQMEEVVENKKSYDLIVTVGSMRAEIAYKFIKKYDLKIPMIFVGVSDPVRLGILSKLASNGHMTGVVSEQMSWVFMARILHRIKPKMKRVLIPYYENAERGFVAIKVTEVKTYFASIGIDCVLHPVTKVRLEPEAIQQILDLLPTVDVLWSIEGGFFDIFSNHLIKECEKHQVTFFSNNAAHIANGAALTFGASIASIGDALFAQVCNVLIDGKKTEELPIIIVPNNRRIAVNVETAKAQGLEIDEALLLSMHHGEVIKNER